jgi:MFS family permease
VTGREPGAEQAGRPAEEPAGQSTFMSALVTEHFVLQTAASTTVTEAAGRATIYLSALSSSLVALGFSAQSPRWFLPFAAAIIPALVVLGLFTTVRLVDTGVQNIRFLAEIARIRRYYRTLAPPDSDYFAPWSRPDENETGQALAVLSRTRGALTGLGTTAAMVAAINSIVAAVGTAFTVIAVFGTAGRIPAAVLAAAVGTLFFGGFAVYQNRRYQSLDAQPNTDARPNAKEGTE